ncbi:MAG: DciA family protein [Pseudomonadota bacterium]|nr:DciA family protein [Pseudomonadota bacterium]MEC8476186.1 DciA family protein [Pseudomonadota bacterium]
MTDKFDSNPLRSSGTPHVSKVLGRITGRTMNRRGFSDSRMLENWSAIVGPQLAAMSQPVRLSRRKSGRDGEETAGGVLTVKAEGAIALEIQHLAPQIIDRLNSYYGYAAIARLNIVQGPVTVTPSPLSPLPIKDEEISALADDFDEIETPRLKRALASLALLMRRDKG